MSAKIQLTKVVINTCYGGFGLSEEALALLSERKGRKMVRHDLYDFPRHDPDLVAIVEELGKAANGKCAKLLIEEIEGPKYWIREYDGGETVFTPDTIDWVSVDAEWKPTR